MTLPIKALTVLQSVKDKLLKPIDLSESVMITLPKRQKVRTSTRMRHAKAPSGYQRWKQRGEGW